MKNLKKIKQIKDNNLIDYHNNIFFYRENNIYFFDSQNIKLSNFITNDYLVAVSALMKLKDIHNFNKLWDTKITKEMKKNIDIKNALYWLSGGDVEWIDNNIYNIKWENCYSLFIQKFEKKLLYINEQVTTLGECKEKLIQELSLPIIYEFALKNKLIK